MLKAARKCVRERERERILFEQKIKKTEKRKKNQYQIKGKQINITQF